MITCFNPICNRILTKAEVKASQEFFATYHYCKQCLDEEMGEITDKALTEWTIEFLELKPCKSDKLYVPDGSITFKLPDGVVIFKDDWNPCYDRNHCNFVLEKIRGNDELMLKFIETFCTSIFKDFMMCCPNQWDIFNFLTAPPKLIIGSLHDVVIGEKINGNV